MDAPSTGDQQHDVSGKRRGGVSAASRSAETSPRFQHRDHFDGEANTPR
ncbi:MAG: hypothetical protein ABFC63_06010 [Thermoguttaceae bacterium]